MIVDGGAHNGKSNGCRIHEICFINGVTLGFIVAEKHQAVKIIKCNVVDSKNSLLISNLCHYLCYKVK